MGISLCFRMIVVGLRTTLCVCWVTVMPDYFVTPWTEACKAPLSLELPRQEYWSGCHFVHQGIFLTRDRTHVSCVSCIGRQILYHYTTWKTPRTILWGKELPTLVYYIPYLLACLKLVSIKAIGTHIKHSFSLTVLSLEFTFLCFYWIIIDLQCCVSLRYTTKWVTFWYQRKGTSIFSQGLKVSGYIRFKKTLFCLVSQLKCFIFISSFRL